MAAFSAAHKPLWAVIALERRIPHMVEESRGKEEMRRCACCVFNVVLRDCEVKAAGFVD